MQTKRFSLGSQQLLSFILGIVLIFGMIPFGVLAEEPSVETETTASLEMTQATTEESPEISGTSDTTPTIAENTVDTSVAEETTEITSVQEVTETTTNTETPIETLESEVSYASSEETIESETSENSPIEIVVSEPESQQPRTRSVATSTLPAPPAVTNLQAFSSGMRMTVRWNASTNAEGYIIYRMAPGEQVFTYRSMTGNTSISDNASVEGFHFFRVYPYRMQGTSRIVGPAQTYVYTRAVKLPLPVTNLQARVLSNGSVRLSWTASATADGYFVRRMIQGQSVFSHLYLTGNTQFVDLKSAKDQWNYYRVLPYRTVANQRYLGTSDNYVYARPSSLSEIANLRAQAGSSGSIELSWSRVTGADGYIIERMLEGGGTFSTLSFVTTNSYRDTQTTAGKYHFYRVRPYRLINGVRVANPASRYVYARPVHLANVSNLRAVTYGQGKIYLTWNPVSNADGYIIQRQIDSNGFVYRYILTGTAFVDTTPLLDDYSYYRVYPYKMVGNQRVLGSSDRYVSAIATSLGAVQNTVATSLGSSGVRLEWTATPGADGYTIFRRNPLSGNFTHLGSSYSTGYTDASPYWDSNNEYLVRAFKIIHQQSVFGPSGQSVTVYAQAGAPMGIPIVNKKNPISPLYYYPDDLVYVGYQGQTLRSEAAAAYNQMSAAAAEAGSPLIAQSGFRSYELQNNLYWMYVNQSGQAAADTFSARPGHSEHQTGLAMDILGGGAAMDDSFAYTSQFAWLRSNAHYYGWILRYPYGQDAITGFMYEPWHWRYIGVDEAIRFYYSGHSTLETFYGVAGGGYY